MAALGFQSETAPAASDDSSGENVAITVHVTGSTRYNRD
jgi:hypothetical protein